MMIQSGLRKTIQTIWVDSGLAPRAQVKVYDNTLGTMILLSALSVSEVETGIYQASFTPIAGVSYVTTARVYTDGTFTTPDVNYAPSGSDFQCIDFAAGRGGNGTLRVLMNAQELKVGGE